MVLPHHAHLSTYTDTTTKFYTSRQSQAVLIKSLRQSGAGGGAASTDMWIMLSIRRRLELGHSDIWPRARMAFTKKYYVHRQQHISGFPRSLGGNSSFNSNH